MRFVLVFYLLICLGCYNQPNLSGFQKDYFDVQEFHKNNPNGEYKADTLKNGNIVEWNQGAEFYQKSIKIKNSPYTLHKKYNKENYLYIGSSEFFRYFPIGISRSYNKEGKLIDEINHDEYFSFSIYDLIAKIKKEYGVDLMNDRSFRGARRFYMKEWDRSFYTVFLYDNPIYCIRRVLLDGNTGEFLYEDYIDEYAPTMYIEDIEDVISREVIKKEKAKE